jgi:hypothetical protein
MSNSISATLTPEFVLTDKKTMQIKSMLIILVITYQSSPKKAQVDSLASFDRIFLLKVLFFHI